MAPADVAGAVEVWLQAVADLTARHPAPGGAPGRPDRPRLTARLDHLLSTDPAGSWVAERRGRVVGLAQSFVRDRLWVLSLLGVDPRTQDKGVGRALLERALGHGAGCPGTIQASVDPRAVRLYATSGFDPHPSMTAFGPPTRRPAAPDGVRVGGTADLDVAASIDRAVRGAGRAVDLRHLVEGDGATLLLEGERAYAVVLPDRVVTLAGRDEGSAAAVLAAALARAPAGRPFEVGWLTAAQRWAFGPLVEAGLALHPRGPVMVRGMDRPPSPALPSGGFG
jgi:GNAT superfamily N-acetyltransferase